jgi:CAAX prenyl protease-like protein
MSTPPNAAALDRALLVRAAPFVLLVVLTSLQTSFGPGGAYWLYLVKTVLAGGLLWWWRKEIPELRWNFSWSGLAVGVLIAVVWVGLDDRYPKLGGQGTPWNPHLYFGEGSPAAWFFVGVRLAGSTVMVACLEEVFFRSFLYRTLQARDFVAVPLNRISWGALAITVVVFGMEHREWLPGLVCGAAYHGLVLWRNRLGDAILAHAVTNFLLGLWIIQRGAWQFW